MIPVSPGSASRRAFLGFASAVAALSLVACTGVGGSTSPTTPAAETTESDVLTVVAIGDSIPFNSSADCPMCTGFVDSFTGSLAAERGLPFEVINRSRHDGAQTSDIREELRSGAGEDALGGADVVIVSTGLNDQPPYGDEGEACYAAELETVRDAIAAVRVTTPDCVATQTAKTAEELATVLETVRDQAPEATLLVLTAYNSWTGWPDLEEEGPEAAASVTATIVPALEAWRTVVCEAAAGVDGACVDLLAAFNGADGTTPAGDLLAADYTHPSQAGNDLIRDLLLAAEG